MARLHSSPEDFQLVGMDDDPTPGDPELIRDVMQRYRDIGDAAEKALNVLEKDGTISVGRGSAMDKLKEKVGDDLPEKLTKTMTSYHDAAAAYADYIPRLQEAQDTFDRAVEQARTAAPQANQQPKTLGDNPTDQDKADARQTQDAIDAGKSELSAAKSLAEQARSMRQTAQRSAADVLDRAAGEAIPERNIFQKIADFFKDFPFVQILLGLLIAVVSVFFPVAGALLGGALFLITELPALASGHFDLGDLLVGLVGLVPGGALFKVGGGLVKGAAEAILPGAAKAVSGGIKGIKSTVDTSRAIGPLAGGNVLKVAGKAGAGFADEAGQEALDEAVHGQDLDAAAILGAGALGLGHGGRKGVTGDKGGGPGGPPGSSDRGLFGKGKGKDTGGTGGGGSKKPGFSFGGLFGKSKKKQQPARPPDDPNIPANHLPSAQAGAGPTNQTIQDVNTGVGNPPVFRQDNSPLFRVDDRNPDDIFANGFQARPPVQPFPHHGDVLAHAQGPSGPGRRGPNTSGFVSTSTSPGFSPTIDDSGDLFQFKVHAPGGVNTNQTLGSGFTFENEILFPGGIRTQNIVGGAPITGFNTQGHITELGPFRPNPNFNPNAVNQQFPNHLPFAPAPPPTPTPPPTPPTQSPANSSEDLLHGAFQGNSDTGA